MARRPREKRERPPRAESLAGGLTLLLGFCTALFLFWRNQQVMSFEEYYLLNTALLLLPPLLLILIVLRRDPSEFGLTTGDLKGGMRIAALGLLLFLPVILIVAPMKPFQYYYLGPSLLSGSRAVQGLLWTPDGYIGGRIDWGRLVFHETIFAFYMFAWEWFFRGFLLTGIRRILPITWAAVIQAALFALLHWGKPPIEVASSFAGALILAYVAVRYKSFLPCFVLHYCIAVSFDCAVLYYHFHH